MSFSSKYNKNKAFKLDTSNYEYFTLQDLYNKNGEDKIYLLKAIYINKNGRFNDSPVFATDYCYVNIPSHMTATAEEILEDNEAIDEINSNKVGFRIYTYVSQKYHKTCYSVEFIDL